MVRAGVMMALLLAAGGAQAAPFSVSADATGAAWVIDETSGALRACRPAVSTGPKVLYLFNGGADAQPGMARAPRTECRVVMRAVAETAPVAARGMLGDGSSGPQVGSAAGMLGIGSWGPSGAGGPDRQGPASGPLGN